MTQVNEGTPYTLGKNHSTATNDLSEVSWTFYHEVSPGRVSPDANTNTSTDDGRSGLDSFTVDLTGSSLPGNAPRRSESRLRRSSFISTSSRPRRGASMETAPEDIVNMNRRMRIDRAVVEDREAHYRHLILREEADALMEIASMHKSFMQQFGLLPDSPLLTPLRIPSGRASFVGGTSPVNFSYFEDQAGDRRDDARVQSPRTSLHQLRENLAEKTRQVEALQRQVRGLEEAKNAAEHRCRLHEGEMTRMRNDACRAQHLSVGGTSKASALIASQSNSVPSTPRRRAPSELEALTPEQQAAVLLAENDELRTLLNRHWRLMRSDYMAYC